MPQFLAGAWLEASVSLPQAPLIVLFKMWQLVSPRGSDEGKERERESLNEKQESTQEATVFYILISKVMYHNFCHFLLATQTKSDTMWDETSQGCKSQEAGIISGHLTTGYHRMLFMIWVTFW